MQFLKFKNVLLAGLFLLFQANLVLAQEDISLCVKGWQNYQAGQYDQALSDYENCMKTGNLSQATKARTYSNMGMAFNARKDTPKAIAAYDQALALRPSDPENDYINKGNTFSAAGDFQAALDSYELALKVKSNSGAAYFNRGIVHEKMRNIDKAKADILMGYQLGFRTPPVMERIGYYQLLATSNSSQPAPSNPIQAALSEFVPWAMRKYACLEKPMTQSEISAVVERELNRSGQSANISRDSIGIAFLTQFPCPFSPFRPELQLASQKDVEGVWLFPEISQNLRYPPISPSWQQYKATPFKCQGVGFYPNGEMRTAIILGAQMQCPFSTASNMDMTRQNPRVASWKLIRDGRLSVSRTDVENHLEEWDIFIATSAFSAANIQVKKGELVAYMRREKGNEINAANMFWHLQKLP